MRKCSDSNDFVTKQALKFVGDVIYIEAVVFRNGNVLASNVCLDKSKFVMAGISALVIARKIYPFI